MQTRNTSMPDAKECKELVSQLHTLVALAAMCLIALICASSSISTQSAFANELAATEINTESATNLAPGDLVYFGRYFQDSVSDWSVVNKLDSMDYETISGKSIRELSGVRFTDAVHQADDGNRYRYYYGESPLRWYVLDDAGGVYTLISENVIDTHEFCNINDGIDLFWCDSTVRKWLNSDFINLAFTADEQQDIITTNVKYDTTGGGYPYGGGSPEFATASNKVYLIDGFEIEQGIFSNSGVPVVAKGTRYIDRHQEYWEYWLRGGCQWKYGNLWAAYIANNGGLGIYYPTYSKGIRPVIRVSKSAAGLSVKCPKTPTVVVSDPNSLALTSAIYSYGSGVTGSKSVDVLTTAHSIEPNHAPFNLTCTCDCPNVQTYILYSGKDKIDESSTGEFKDIDPAKFNELQEVSVIVKGANNSRKTSLCLEIKSKSLPFGAESVKLFGNGFEFRLSDSIPLIGGREVYFDTPELPFEAVVEDGKIKIGVNIEKSNLISGDSYEGINTEPHESKSLKELMEDWADDLSKTKSIVKDAKAAAKRASKDKGIINNMRKYMKKKNLASNIPFLEGKVSVSLMAYFEAAWSDKLESVEGQLVVIFTGSGTLQGQAVVIVVPATANLKVTGKATIGGRAHFNFTKNPLFEGDIASDFSIAVEPYVGVGVGQWASVGFYGEIEPKLNVIWVGTQDEAGPKEFTISGDVGAKAYVATMEYKAKILSMEALRRFKELAPYIDGDKFIAWSRDGRGWANNLGAKMSANSVRLELQSDLYANPDKYFEPVQLNSSSVSLQAASDGDPVLVERVYPGAQPQMAHVQGKTVMAYVDADDSRSELNRTVLKYALYDEGAGSFGEVRAVDDDGTADMMPRFHQIGDDLYVSYLNSRRIFDEGDDPELSDYVESFGVSIARLNTATNMFESLGAVDTGASYCFSPALTATSEGVQCVWVENSDGNVFGSTGQNDVYKSIYANGEWSAPEAIVEDAGCITGVACGTLDDDDAIAYAIDADGNLTTRGQLLFARVGEGAFAQVAQGNLSAPTFGELEGVNVLAYNQDGALMSLANMGSQPSTVMPVGSMDSEKAFVLCDDGVYCLKTSDDTRNIMRITRGSDGWNEALITNEADYIDSFSVADGKLVYVLTKVDEAGDDFDSTSNLVFHDSIEAHDLTLEQAQFDYSEAKPGTLLDVGVVVANNGTETVDSLEIGLREKGSSTFVDVKELPVSLAPGETYDLAVQIELPDDLGVNEYEFAVVQPGVEDAQANDNAIVLDVAKADLVVKGCFTLEDGERYFDIDVCNEGHIAAESTTRVMDVDGDELEEYVDIVEPGETVSYHYLVTDSLLNQLEGQVILLATCETDMPERYISNNTADVRIWDLALSDPVEFSNEKADEVAGLIAELPDPSDLTKWDEALVEEARALYESLTDEQKMLVSDEFVKLVKAEARINNLKMAASKLKMDNPMTACAKSKMLKVKYKKLKKKKQVIKASKAFKVTGAKGKVSFTKLAGNKKISVSTAGKVTIKKKGLKKRKSYQVRVRVYDSGNAVYAPTARDVTIKIKVV